MPFDHRPFFHRHVLLLLPPMAVAAAANILWIPMLLARSQGKLIVSVLFLLFLLMMGFMVTKDLQLVSTKSGIPESEREVIQLIQENSRPTDFVVSDEQMQVFRAGRLIPPQHCDNSFVRIDLGYLTDEAAIEGSKKARIIIFATDRLTSLPQYTKWVKANYRLIKTFEKSRTKIYLQDDAEQVGR